jgi:small-conductance mechanosensitive channel
LSSAQRRSFLAIGVLLILILAALVAGNGLAPLIGGVDMRVNRILNLPLLTLGKQPLTSLSLIKIALFLAVLGLVARFSREFLQKKLLVHTRLEKGQQYAMSRVLSYVIFAVGLIVGLESLGLDLSSLLVLGGALGLGVGLGLQTVVSNFVAGLILLIEQPVKVGDRIEVGNTYGDVVALKARSTWVRTNDNVVIIVPNSDFIEKSVTNWTANDRSVRIPVPIGVSYDSDPAQVRDVLLRIAAAHPDVLPEPAPDVVFLDFGDSTLDFQLRVWTQSKVQVPAVLKSDLYYSIFEEFRHLEIELSFPQRDLHLRSISRQAAEVVFASGQRSGQPDTVQMPQRP